MNDLSGTPLITLSLSRRAQSTPHKLAFSFGDRDQEQLLTYAVLEERARRLAAVLVRRTRPQERVVLLCPPGLDYIVGFFACLFAGLIAVPAYPPRQSRRNDRNLQRLLGIVKGAEPRIALTTPPLLRQLEPLLDTMPAFQSVSWMLVETPQESAAEPLETIRLKPEDVAFLQYTSGSTSKPKGVVVTHGNLAANAKTIRDSFQTDETTPCVGWLPLYHDMGLIGNIMQPIYAGFSCHLMTPVSFLQQPLRWLQAITQRRAFISGGPNFAYELCVNRISEEQKQGLDLSGWRVAFNGSEPIRAETMERFTQAFSGCGFRAEAFFPCYGLAESTLMVSGGPPRERPVIVTCDTRALQDHRLVELPSTGQQALTQNAARRLVASGAVCGDTDLRIVHPRTREPLPADRIGEIWLRGPSVAAGYYHRPEADQDSFAADLNHGEGPFLRTGDFGFILRGRLFITGRLKELLIIRGRNHYPQDIEATVQEAHQGLRPGCGASFTVTLAGEEELVVVQEVARTYLRHLKPEPVIRAIRRAVAAQHGLQSQAVVLIKPGTLPKTTSGKIRRNECRHLFLSGALIEVGRHLLQRNVPKPTKSEPDPLPWSASDTTEERRARLVDVLRGALAQVLRLKFEAIAPDRPLGDLGLDSLAAVEFQHFIERATGTTLPLDELLDESSIDELALQLANLPEARAQALSTGEPPTPEQVFPLSLNQLGLWFLHRLNPDSAAYHIPLALRLGAGTDGAALQRALLLLVERHPVLRSRFEEYQREPRQRFSRTQPTCFTVIDAGQLDDSSFQETLLASVQAPIDLQAGAAFRAELYRRSGGRQVLLLVAHHLICDLWSLSLLIKEMATLYTVIRQGGEPEAARASLHYGDFVERQRNQLANREGERLWVYWRETLAGSPAALRLTTDKQRPAIQTYNGAQVDFNLPQQLHADLYDLARQTGTTAYTLFLAAYQLLLYRYSGQTDIPVGSPTDGRGAAFAEVSGDFVNTLILRGSFGDKPDFRTHLQRTRTAVLGALAHRDFPFQLLVERLCPSRDPAFSPLFQAMFSLQKTHLIPGAASFVLGHGHTRLQLGDLQLTPYPLPARNSQTDLALIVVEETHEAGGRPSAKPLPCRWIYNPDLFHAVTIQRLALAFRQLLTQIIADPNRPVSHYQLMDERERQALLREWNDNRRDYPRGEPLHRLIATKARHWPDRIALVFEDQSRTYAQIDAAADRLARRLTAAGIQNETPVGICLTRCVMLPIAVLAVLKAGAAYLPLDPGYPEERLRYIVEDARVPLVLTDGASEADWAPDGTRLLPVAAFEPDQHDPNPPHNGTIENLAYIIYTSGSTGRPKGVMVQHRALINFLGSMANRPGLTENDRLLAVTTISFDIAGLELFLPLLQGAVLVLAGDAESIDARLLSQNLNRNRITLMQATPTHWQMLLAEGWSGQIKALCGGEALPAELARRLLERGVSLWNMYGPTETTIWSSLRPIRAACRGEGTEPLGPPIANTSLFVVDARGEPVPRGLPGELLIGGHGLARGYFRQAPLTAVKFVPNPFADETGTRLYRTGDLVRYRRDGSLSFLGRIDHQIKLRGYRIETGEIEALLTRHERVGQAVAVVRQLKAGDQRLVAYVVGSDGFDPEREPEQAAQLRESLRDLLRRRLPEYMLPSHLMILPELPLTPNGKIDRKALPSPVAAAQPAYRVPGNDLETGLAEIWRQALQVETVGLNDNFFELGGHSLLLTQVNRRINQDLKLTLTMVEMFQHPTVAALAEHIAGQGQSPADTNRKSTRGQNRRDRSGTRDDIAVVAMACRFPGAPDPESFWQNLTNGVASFEQLDDDELLANGVDPKLLTHPDYVKVGSFLKDPDRFDAQLFDLSPREAKLIDPQQRLFLELAWEVLERAAINPDTYPGAIGVYAGTGMNTYLFNHLRGRRGLLEREGGLQLMFAGDKDFLATRASYKLNLKGPSVTVQTACSTSLVAVHHACQSLHQGESDMALAGGVTIRVPHRVGYLYQEGIILSPDGRCRAFDARAAGTVSGSGAGIVLLKRLADARADGDRILAVVKGSAVNNDASVKVGYTAPSVDGQSRVISEALAVSGVSAENIGYVEAHGTGTKLGDPIEIAALTKAYRTYGERRGYCALGSVKTNIGHMDTASGIAGFIKTVLALQHRTLPPSLNFERPNPEIDFESSPFFVNTQNRPWRTDGAVRIAGVSSFGIGGTNAHAILAEAPETPPSAVSPDQPQLLLLSAKTAAALDQACTRLATSLEGDTPVDLADAAHTLRVGRRLLPHRRALLVDGRQQAAAALSGQTTDGVFGRVEERHKRPVVFLFSGQGSQYPAMAAGLYQREPAFREALDRCADLLTPQLDLKALLWGTDDTKNDAGHAIHQTQHTQPALFSVSYALATMWLQWGLEPKAMLGHSIGEYAAACLAGVFSLEKALHLVAARGRLMASLPPGRMLAVPLSEDELKPRLGDSLSLAAVNAPGLCAVSGPAEAIAALQQELTREAVQARPIRTSHAFHSRMMDPILETFAAEVRKADPQTPSRAFISNLSGDWIRPEQARDPDYWVRHLRGTVRFADGLSLLCRDPQSLFLEVGPGRTLLTLLQRHPEKGRGRVLLQSLPHPQEPMEDLPLLLQTAGKLWLTGSPLDWHAFRRQEPRRRILLPTYPFQRQSYWIKPNETPTVDETASAQRQDPAHWYYLPSWKRLPAGIGRGPVKAATPILVMGAETPLGRDLVSRLRAQGGPVVALSAGKSFSRQGEETYSLDPGKPESFRDLFQVLQGRNRMPATVLHAWPSMPKQAAENDWTTRLDHGLDLGFFPLLFLARALADLEYDRPLHLIALTQGAQEVGDERQLDPFQAMLSGALRVIPQEFPFIRGRTVDLPVGTPSPAAMTALLAEIAVEDEHDRIALRGSYRWVGHYEPQTLPPAGDLPTRLKKNGVYLITGGFGGIGLSLANFLAETYHARLILTTRGEVPVEDTQSQKNRPESSGNAVGKPGSDGAASTSPEVAIRLAALHRLRAAGANVVVIRADVADRQAMARGLETARARFGAIDGVLHTAGIAGGGLIRTRPREAALAVMDAKLRGTLVLDDLLRTEPPEFMLLFSSINAVIGGIGQSDYAAANAFLDAFAGYRSTTGLPTISVNWDSWRGVGMAAAALGQRRSQAGEAPLQPADHPLFDGWREQVRGDQKSWIFPSTFSIDTTWLLHEHWILGRAIVPGTAYLEMARAAYAQLNGGAFHPITLRDVFFLVPLVLRENETRSVRTELIPQGPGYQFTVTSSATGTGWIEHARGTLEPVAVDPPSETGNLTELGARCNLEHLDTPMERDHLGGFRLTPNRRELPAGTTVPLTLITDRSDPPEVSIELGSRWTGVSWIKLGETEGLARLNLAEEHHHELAQYQLHPALLDFAVGFFRLFKDQANYLPLSYKNLHQFRPLTPVVHSHIRFARGYQPGQGNPNFDIDLLDQDGRSLVHIESFSLGRIDTAKLKSEAPKKPVEKRQNAPTAEAAWLSPAEGVDVFARIMATNLNRVVVSTRPLGARFTEAASGSAHLQADEERPVHPRPDLMTPYAPPRNETEKRLAEIWQNVIGLTQVGIHDDFFELGGDSLLITRVHTKVREKFDSTLSIAELMQHATLAKLAVVLNEQDPTAERQNPLAKVAQRSAKQKKSLQLQKRLRRRRTGTRPKP